MKQMVLLIICSTLSTLGWAQHDKDNYNQWASMEYKQWKFTPESYYYSWYKKKIDMGLFSITIKLPGLGIHDDGVGGTGIGGDHYVDQSWRQMSPLRVTATSIHTIETEAAKKEDEYWKPVMSQDLLTIADRNLDAAYEMSKKRREKLKAEIITNIALVEDDETKITALFEYNRILANVQNIRKCHMDNAKKIVAYDNENTSLEKLANILNSACVLQETSKIINIKEE